MNLNTRIVVRKILSVGRTVIRQKSITLLQVDLYAKRRVQDEL